MLEVRELVGGYAATTVLRDVSLEVAAGEVVCILGPNGAGKTSLVRAVLGLLPRMTGSIQFQGRELIGLPAYRIPRQGIGVVPEGKGLFPRMTVRENLRMGAIATRDQKVLESRIGEAFELFPRLADRQAQVAGTMSGGEQMMLAIGRSLMSHPDLVILDEPSFGLAPVLVDEVFHALSLIASEGKTVLLVEQAVEKSLKLATRGYVLQKGAVVARGSASELERSDVFTQAYLAADVSE